MDRDANDKCILLTFLLRHNTKTPYAISASAPNFRRAGRGGQLTPWPDIPEPLYQGAAPPRTLCPGCWLKYRWMVAPNLPTIIWRGGVVDSIVLIYSYSLFCDSSTGVINVVSVQLCTHASKLVVIVYPWGPAVFGMLPPNGLIRSVTEKT